MYFAVCLTVFLASRGVAVDPLEERITRMEDNMNGLMSWIQEALMRMTEEIQIIKTQSTIEIEEHVNIEDITSISPTIATQLKDKTLEERLQGLEYKMANVDQVIGEVATLEDMVKDFSISNTELNAFVTELDVRVTSLESQNGANDNITDELDEVDVLEAVTDLHITVSNLDEAVTGLE